MARLPPHEKVEAFASMLTAHRGAGGGPAPKLDARDYVVRERLNDAVRFSLMKGLTRFNPEKDLTEVEIKGLPADWLSTFHKMDLSDCHGWPMWEKEVSKPSRPPRAHTSWSLRASSHRIISF